jgi:hypothetical protein
MSASISSSLGPDTEPAGILQNCSYPHSVRFTADDRHMLVAYAGSLMLHVYERGAHWGGRRLPSRSIAVRRTDLPARQEGRKASILIGRTASWR